MIHYHKSHGTDAPLASTRSSFARRATFLLLSRLGLSVAIGWCPETVIVAGWISSSDGDTIPSGVNLRFETAEGMLVQIQPSNREG
jgi:hypothetical protein